MKENLETAIGFARKICGQKGIIQIALFGSVARGEDTSSSDIDIAVIHDREEKFDFMKAIGRLKPEKAQLTFVHIGQLPQETELVGALTGEGLLLYGKPIIIRQGALDLQAKAIIVYSLAHLPATEKMKINRSLYGSISISSYGKKKYRTVVKGFIAEPGVEKIANGVLLVNREKKSKIINMLKRFGAKARETFVWTY